MMIHLLGTDTYLSLSRIARQPGWWQEAIGQALREVPPQMHAVGRREWRSTGWGKTRPTMPPSMDWCRRSAQPL